MKNVIIGIHGLKNKPPKDVLEKWWKASIENGLNNIGYQYSDFQFELVYWADLEYSKPLDPSITDTKDPLYIEHPYITISRSELPEKEPTIKRRILDRIEKGLDKIILNEERISGIEKIVDSTIRRMFRDLDAYYYGFFKIDKKQIAFRAFRNRLIEVLQKHKRDRIMLIGHSMGSIISYDTLTQEIPKLKIDTFITIGSPLGFPLIIKKILKEQNIEINSNAKPVTPENIISGWFNFSDLDDKITLNYDLADDYLPNAQNIKPVDVIINNTYEYNRQKNPHKVYGYLQDKEVAKIISEFLSKQTSFFVRFLKRFKL
ncbi:MAG: hypothetical protein P9M11_01280 [Candidatus Tenebribacter burtonii]|nr:hypothetical protein [Candidatus Tenebribacter burtonii]